MPKTTAVAQDGVETIPFARDGRIPNNDRLPLVLYRNALPPSADPATQCEALFHQNGWGGGWRAGGVHPYLHYHSTRHEAIGVVRGSSRVRLGGPNGAVVEIKVGDVVVIPAGVAHEGLSASEDFLIVGAYPFGLGKPDLCTGSDEPGAIEREIENINSTKMPVTDPVFGKDGPLIEHWLAG